MEHGVVKTPDYLKMNPNSLVPTIDDDGFVLWESHAIVRYLAAKHGAGTLWPADLKQRADSDRWMDWAHTFAREFQRPVFWALARTPPAQRDMNAVREAVRKCARAAGGSRPGPRPSPLPRRQQPHHRRHPARLPRAAVDAAADRAAPGARQPAGLVRPPVRAPGVHEDGRYPDFLTKASRSAGFVASAFVRR